ncbi:hypothetical protein ABVQ20_20050 [Mesorhizobium shangrilense]|uniref:Uncharacterized protein n=1 Tax=Mesorhizobium shangrilense TaxID=460060 RepID=A0ABV2DGU8_9HYPH
MLIKDNHIAIAGDIRTAIARARAGVDVGFTPRGSGWGRYV